MTVAQNLRIMTSDGKHMKKKTIDDACLVGGKKV